MLDTELHVANIHHFPSVEAKPSVNLLQKGTLTKSQQPGKMWLCL